MNTFIHKKQTIEIEMKTVFIYKKIKKKHLSAQ